MSFASISDIQTWPREDRIDVNDVNSVKPSTEADRLIRAQLAGVFTPTVIASWVDPASTPELIRSIAGRLAAAYLIRNLYSEESNEVPAYATELYVEAVAMLTDIRASRITVVGANGVPITEATTDISFWPDDSTDGPYFTMSQNFA